MGARSRQPVTGEAFAVMDLDELKRLRDVWRAAAAKWEATPFNGEPKRAATTEANKAREVLCGELLQHVDALLADAGEAAEWRRQNGALIRKLAEAEAWIAERKRSDAVEAEIEARRQYPGPDGLP